MPYNNKQYDAAKLFTTTVDPNIVSVWDQARVASYDLYENIYNNAMATLKLVLRGDDQSPILMPNGKKLIEATHRFLGINLGYLVEAQGDAATQKEVDEYFKDLWAREDIATKFSSNKRWGLVRGDFYFYINANPNKAPGKRISINELDPRQVFEIEDDPNDPFALTGVHIVDLIQDLREPDKPDKQVARRRTFRQMQDEQGAPIGVTSELLYFEVGKWDDRTPEVTAKLAPVKDPVFTPLEEEEFQLPNAIVHLPVYKWNNNKPQGSSWGVSQLSGLETLLYAINQTLSDEDATIVFQGLGMYVTNASPPLDPTTGDVTDWNIGPKQIIELSGDQRFERVTGISDIQAFTEHIAALNDGMAEASGTPQTAIGRVDVSVAQSGISLKLELMPLIAANAEKELGLINTMDSLFHDLATEWLPAYEEESFGNLDVMAEISVVCVFDDPMPRDHDAEVTEVVTLDTANLILKSMAIAKLRELGWKYPTVDPNTGAPLTDDDIAQMLLSQAQSFAAAQDPFAGAFGGGNVDENGNPVNDQGQPVDTQGNPLPNTPDKKTISLGTS